MTTVRNDLWQMRAGFPGKGSDGVWREMYFVGPYNQAVEAFRTFLNDVLVPSVDDKLPADYLSNPAVTHPYLTVKYSEDAEKIVVRPITHERCVLSEATQTLTMAKSSSLSWSMPHSNNYRTLQR